MKTFTLPKEEAQILMQVLNSAPTSGITVGQMRVALKIAALVEPAAAGGTIELEDSDHNWVADRLNKQEWVIVSPKIINLVDLVKDAVTPEKEASA